MEKPNEYYIPSIEEFILGFKYEFHGMTTGGLLIADLSNQDRSNDVYHPPSHKVWMKEVITTNPIYGRSIEEIQELITNGQIRAIKK